MDREGAAFDCELALWAEFRAGKDGGGTLSSSSLSDSIPVEREKEGIGAPLVCGLALGVVSGEGGSCEVELKLEYDSSLRLLSTSGEGA
jgi:hypothetical protein